MRADGKTVTESSTSSAIQLAIQSGAEYAKMTDDQRNGGSGRDILESLSVHEKAVERPRKGAVAAAVGEVTADGDFAQFGVYRGNTARIIESLMTGDRKLHLFDSFEGLPEDWTKVKRKGAFRLSAEDIPIFDSPRVVMHKGWFKDSVPVWGQEATRPLAFIHMDADLYSSTTEALFNIDHLIPKDAIILFDEYVMGHTEDEHRALLDWASKFNREYQYLWRSRSNHVCLRMTK